MPTDFDTLAVGGARVALDPEVGNIRTLEFDTNGKPLCPLHTAHWVDEPDPVRMAGIPLVDQRLAGDFICAPFGASENSDTPQHGWTSNSRWTLRSANAGQGRWTLDKTVQGARVAKTLTLKPDHPVLYQHHEIQGGQGGITFSHHPMFQMTPGDALCFSAKRFAASPTTALVAGRNWLACGQRSTDLAHFPGVAGPADLTHYPAKPGHEDFVTLPEQAGRTIGWTALLRAKQNDLILILKDPRVLPVTMLWFSNGGRDQYPWDGRHTGVLGVEDGIASGADGLAAALGNNTFKAAGIPTALALSKDHVHHIRHAIVAVPRPAGWQKIVDVIPGPNALTVHAENGQTLGVPFDGAFFPT